MARIRNTEAKAHKSESILQLDDTGGRTIPTMLVATPGAPARRTNRNLTNNERLAVLHILLQHQACPGRLQRKATRMAADAHKIQGDCIRRLSWR
eukprot:jgi/Psemu1/50355/gm1.50355_g